MMALWPISSTKIIAVSWSSGWLMVTIWPSFIRCLITSEALTAILCANSATVMVSGTCTSITRTSVGADCMAWSSRSRSLPDRRPRGPPRQLPPRPAPAPVSPRVGMAFFLAGSPAQLLDSLADLTSLPAPAGALVPGAPGAPGRAGLATVVPAAGLCNVPLSPVLAASTAPGLTTGLTSSGFFGGGAGFLAGADIMSRIAAASASAFRRRSPRSAARATSSSARALAAAAALARSTSWDLTTASALAAASCALAAALSEASWPRVSGSTGLAFSAAASAALSSTAFWIAACSAASRARASRASRWRLRSTNSSSWRRISSA